MGGFASLVHRLVVIPSCDNRGFRGRGGGAWQRGIY